MMVVAVWRGVRECGCAGWSLGRGAVPVAKDTNSRLSICTQSSGGERAVQFGGGGTPSVRHCWGTAVHNVFR